jgi:hypothetical protein
MQSLTKGTFMRMTTRFSLVLALALGATAAVADEFPPRKPGLWEVALTAEKHTPVTMKMCLDRETDQLFQKFGTDVSVPACPHADVKVVGSVATAQAQCKIAGSTLTSTAVMNFKGDEAFHSEIKTHFEPAVMGRTDIFVAQEGKWSGPCPTDMKPGDFTAPNGMKLNIKMLSSLKKLLPVN